MPGGFGGRGTEGMIYAVQYARENKIPFLGICMGMQVSLIEAAKNQLGWEDANSTEFDPDTTHPIIHLMPNQHGQDQMGGTLRLGNWECHLKEGSILQKLYGRSDIVERHRHRYEFNKEFKTDFENTGLVFSGINIANELLEAVERTDHPYFVACQYHPEFKSRPNRPHPLFIGLIDASMKLKEGDE